MYVANIADSVLVVQKLMTRKGGKTVKKILFIMLAVVLAISLGLIGCTAPAQQEEEEEEEEPEVIELTYACSQPEGHPMSEIDLEWIDRIEEQTDGRVHITSYFGGSLIDPRQCLIELEKGVADLSDFSAAYMKEGYYIDKAIHAFFYGMVDPDTGGYSWEIGRLAYNDARDKFPEIDAEFSGIKVLARQDISSYELITTTPVRTLDDLEGLTIKASGTNIAILTVLGAEGMSVPMPDVYTNLQKNIIDGAFAPLECLKSFNFAEVAKYVTLVNMGSSPSPHRGMNLDTWNSLPADIQEVFEDNIEWWGVELSKKMSASGAEGVTYAEGLGVEFIELSPEELSEFYEAVDAIILEEMAALDDMGIPATEIYQEIRSSIEE